MLDLEDEVPEAHVEEEEAEKEQETPLKNKKKKIVSLFDFTRDHIYEASAKVVEIEHSKEIIVFLRVKKRRQQQMLTDEVAAANAFQRKLKRDNKLLNIIPFAVLQPLLPLQKLIISFCVSNFLFQVLILKLNIALYFFFCSNNYSTFSFNKNFFNFI